MSPIVWCVKRLLNRPHESIADKFLAFREAIGECGQGGEPGSPYAAGRVKRSKPSLASLRRVASPIGRRWF